ncbi:hypothetical protein WICPIJ_009420 [Wickerhamomyces pijperi]|uniref:tRNA ligase kinase domain-containing protein n=1 Tax=Wickerhamomyces pijperi TaxID=599730 RepID=A0A9P8TDA3_WICPI|nr:hypothetical protein WICPIJ_009420 [Wickerhamomyces pijperi]
MPPKHKQRKYIISVVSIISTYKSPILQALHNYLPYSSYLQNDIHETPDSLFIRAKQELEREDIQCVILKKNNHRGRQRKYMFEQLESLKDMYDIQHICLDFVGYAKDLNTTEFRNYLFSRIMKNDTTEVVNPIDMKLGEIEQLITTFTTEYTPLALAKQTQLYDLVITLNFKNPNVYLSLTMIVDKLRHKYGKDLFISNVNKQDISQFSAKFDQKIKRIESQIKKEGALSMSGYVYQHETSHSDQLPVKYVIIPVSIKHTGYTQVNEILHRQYLNQQSSCIIDIEIPRDFKDKLTLNWQDKDVVLLNATNETIKQRQHLQSVLNSFDDQYRYRAIWLDYMPFMGLESELSEADNEQLQMNLHRFYKTCIKNSKTHQSCCSDQDHDLIVSEVYQSGLKFQQVLSSELETLKHYFIDMTVDTLDESEKVKVGDVQRYLQVFLASIQSVYPGLAKLCSGSTDHV